MQYISFTQFVNLERLKGKGGGGVRELIPGELVELPHETDGDARLCSEMQVNEIQSCL